MHRRTIRLAAALLTFYAGASPDFYAREPHGETTDCLCTSARCRVVEIVDHPLTSLLHPAETTKLLLTARWAD